MNAHHADLPTIAPSLVTNDLLLQKKIIVFTQHIKKCSVIAESSLDWSALIVQHHLVTLVNFLDSRRQDFS